MAAIVWGLYTDGQWIVVLGGIPVFLARYGIDVAPVLIKNETVSQVFRNYSYVASTTAINNAAARQLPAIKLITH